MSHSRTVSSDDDVANTFSSFPANESESASPAPCVSPWPMNVRVCFSLLTSHSLMSPSQPHETRLAPPLSDLRKPT